MSHSLRFQLGLCFVFAFFLAALPLSYAKGNKASPPTATSASISMPSGAFNLVPAPHWVNDDLSISLEKKSSSALFYPLIDRQTRLETSGPTHYNRIVKVINDPSGLSSAGNVRIVFNPSYETLMLHKIDTLRNGRRINAINKNKIKLLQRETQLEYQIYDGRVTLNLTLEDLRVGDAIDMAYSIKGNNPVFLGKYVDTIWTIAGDGDVSQMRFRLLAPEKRALHFRPSIHTEVSTRKLGTDVETVFLRKNAPQWQGEENTPAVHYLQDQIRLSEFSSWQEIANWGQSLFAIANSNDSPEVQAVIAQIRQQASTPEDQLRLAVDFVQKEIRYFGTEIGPYSHQPALASKVLNQRFGDCKDKAALLSAILRGLDIQAQTSPVLASLDFKTQVDDSFPTPLAFDHAITRVDFAGKTYWLDGTRAMQTGALDLRQSFGLGKTLVLAPSTTGLSSTPDTTQLEYMHVEDTFEVRNWQSTPRLTSKTTYYGESAEMIRYVQSLESKEKAQISYAKNIARTYPTLVADSPPVIEEVAHQNAIRITQTFTVPKYWQFPERRLLVANYSLWGLVNPLRYTHQIHRKQPFQIASSGIYRHSVRVQLPEAVNDKTSSKQLHESNKNLDFDVSIKTESASMNIDGVLRIHTNLVSAADWKAYTDFLQKLEKNLGGSFVVPLLSQSDATRVRQQIDEMVRSWNQGLFFTKNKPKTRVQSEARVNHLILTAQLNAGRLDAEKQAQILQERGIQLDYLGQFQEANFDFEKAMQLTPDNAGLYMEAAVNAFGAGNDTLALARLRKSIELDPNTRSHLRMQARLNYFAGNYKEAKQNLQEALKNTEDGWHSFGLIELALVAKHLKEDAQSLVATYNKNTSTSDWPYPIVQAILGTSSVETAIKLARTNSSDDSQLCEAYYYLAENFLAEGNKEKAKTYYEKAIDTGVVEFIEYTMAKRRLASM